MNTWKAESVKLFSVYMSTKMSLWYTVRYPVRRSNNRRRIASISTLSFYRRNSLAPKAQSDKHVETTLVLQEPNCDPSTMIFACWAVLQLASGFDVG
jgi:hypothetical protein